MGITVVIALKIEDYEKFQAAFSQRESARASAKIEAKAYRDMDDPNRVVVIGTTPSKESFLEFMTSAEQKQAMKTAGVQSPPDVTFLNT